MPKESPRAVDRVIFTVNPGTYRTQLFAIPVEFTRNDLFRTLGERIDSVSLDWQWGPGCGNSCRFIYLYSLESKEFDLDSVAEHECIGGHERGERTLAGHPAAFLDLRTLTCILDLGELPTPWGGEYGAPGQRYQFYKVTLAGGTHLVVEVAVESSELLGRYEADVLAPVLATLRILGD